MLRVDYRPSDSQVELSWSIETSETPWLGRTIDILEEATNYSLTRETGRRVSLPWWKFLQANARLGATWRASQLELGKDVILSLEVKKRLSYEVQLENTIGSSTPPEPDNTKAIATQLDQKGFRRDLTAQQLRNVSFLVRFSAGATFSVPGAGKTTEALAYFTLRSRIDDGLLVVAPKNAFASWDEQLSDCLGHEVGFTRLRGGAEKIADSLRNTPRFAIITYQQLVLVSDIVNDYLHNHESFVFLDESHKIKSGEGSVTADAVLSLSHLPVGKLIMSGTPMPQSTKDLVPQSQFLFPSRQTDEYRVVDDIRNIYVRTTKAELGLPDMKPESVPLEMSAQQQEIYGLLKSETLRKASELDRDKQKDFRQLGNSIMRMLQFCSEPLLLAESLDPVQAELLSALYTSGDSPKIEYLLKKARGLASANQKVLIWSSFRRNVEYIAARLSDMGAVYIHGGVDAGSDEDDDTREGKIRRFKTDRNTMVLVANPAAAGEGISLHQVCHHAIYLDRTFNAAHYLQSLDRIHRLGLKKDQITNVQVLQYVNSLDIAVEKSLSRKVANMAQVLGDPSLNVELVPVADDSIDSSSIDGIGLDTSDVQDILQFLKA